MNSILAYTAAGIVITTIAMLWFLIVLLVAKRYVGKDAKIQQILFFLVVGGPIGWIIILIIFFYDLVDKFSQKKFKKSIDK